MLFRSFTLINIILAYNEEPKVPWLPIEVATSLAPIDELVPTPMPLPLPIRYLPSFFINLIREDSLISNTSNYY